MKFYLETSRLILRDLLPEDVEGMYELDSNPEVHRYLGNHPIVTREEAKKIIQIVRYQYDKYGIGRLAIVEKKSGDFIGWAGLKYELDVEGKSPYYDLGYRLIERFWNKGYATEAARESIKYGIETLKLKRINAAAHIKNAASNKIIKNLGFQMMEELVIYDEPCFWYELEATSYTPVNTSP
jgi:ribosomal-protein-alanine N-acetyltransferase